MRIRKLIVSSVKKMRSDMIHARIQEFSSGGGGGVVQVHLAYKKSSDNVFFVLFFFVLNLFYRSPVVTFKDTIICQGSSGD